jgi:hypothetical protein
MSRFIPNSTMIPNAFFDDVMQQLSEKALRAYLLIARKTTGWGKEWDSISISQFRQFTGMKDERTVRAGLNELIAFGLIKPLQKPGHPTKYSLVTDSAPPTSDVPPTSDAPPTSDVKDPLHQMHPTKTNNTKTKENIYIGNDKETDPVNEIFDYWKSVLNHPRAKMDAKRKNAIKNALKIGYEIDDLKAAIVGCSLTPHNMGINENHQKYDDIELILRSASHIDRFISNSISTGKKKSQGSATNRNQGSIGTKPTTRTISHENFADKDYGQSTVTAPWLAGAGIN